MTQSHCNASDSTELLRSFRETSGQPSENSRVLLLLSSAEPLPKETVGQAETPAHSCPGNSLECPWDSPRASRTSPVAAHRGQCWQQVSPACSLSEAANSPQCPGQGSLPSTGRLAHSPGSTRGKAGVSCFQLSLRSKPPTQGLGEHRSVCSLSHCCSHVRLQ